MDPVAHSRPRPCPPARVPPLPADLYDLRQRSAVARTALQAYESGLQPLGPALLRVFLALVEERQALAAQIQARSGIPVRALHARWPVERRGQVALLRVLVEGNARLEAELVDLWQEAVGA